MRAETVRGFYGNYGLMCRMEGFQVCISEVKRVLGVGHMDPIPKP